MLSALREEALSYAGSGFGILKIKIGLLRPKDDLARIRVIREALDPDVDLLVDANHGYNAATACFMAREMAPLGVRWFEEPVPPEDREGYRKVRAEGAVPVAGGEAEFTHFGFRDLIAGGCVDIAQPDVACCGGFSAFQ
jgi:D-galactarolactone cycloisomerase